MSLDQIPRHVFLDTCVVNFILDHGDAIHENAMPGDCTLRVQADVAALREVWLTGQRANWRISISTLTVAEVQATRDVRRRQRLHGWVSELAAYQMENGPTAGRTPASAKLEAALAELPEENDRRLIQDSIHLGCDAFCTRDWSTILKHRDLLAGAGVRIITPAEWGQTIRPYAALWA